MLDQLRLRQKVLRALGRAVLVRPTVDYRHRPRPIAMRRRRRRRPLQRVRVPWILGSLRALEIAVDDVGEEEKLRGAEHESADRNKLVDRDDRLQEIVLL